MKTIYVNTNYELTVTKLGYEFKGMETFRTRTTCGCMHKDNRRNAVIAVQGDTVMYKVIRCRGCVRKEAEHGTI